MKLKILYMNDMHSRFEELAKIASAIEEIRDENTIVLDACNNADFARLEIDRSNTAKTWKGKPGNALCVKFLPDVFARQSLGRLNVYCVYT